MRKFLGMLVGAAAIAAPFAASAQTGSYGPRGWYGSLNGGLLFLQDADGNFGPIGGVETSYDTGYSFSGALGYRFGNNFRAEGEFGYGHSSIDEVKVGGGTYGVSDGDVNIYSFTANGFYDIPTGTLITPYVGAGIGLVRTDFDTGTVNVNGTTVSGSRDDDTNLTLLAEVGAAVAVAPNIAVVPSYRYQWINNGDEGFDNDSAHMLRVGLRFNF